MMGPNDFPTCDMCGDDLQYEPPIGEEGTCDDCLEELGEKKFPYREPTHKRNN